MPIWSRLQPRFDNFIDRLEGLRVLESTMRNEQNSCGEASVLLFCSWFFVFDLRYFNDGLSNFSVSAYVMRKPSIQRDEYVLEDHSAPSLRAEGILGAMEK